MNNLSQKTLIDNNIDLIAVDEVFTQIPKWGAYYISNHGRLIHKNDKEHYSVVNPSISTGGYLTYTLSKRARYYRGEKVRDKNGKAKGQRQCYPAHRLVAMLYVHNSYPATYRIQDLDVHHKNHTRTDNYYKNLMWLSRKDHRYLDTIKKISIYSEEHCTFRTYKDIELLAKRIDIDILELIDSLRYGDRLFKSQDGKWDVYQVNGYFLGIHFYRRRN